MAFLRSLRARVLLWVSVALTVLFALTVAALDVTFRQTNESARRELLEAQLLGLAVLAEPTEDGSLDLPTEAINPQLSVADSGLYGILWDADGNTLWRSLSLLERDLPVKPLLEQGEPRRYVFVNDPGFPPLEALLMRIAWDDEVEPYIFGIAVSLEPYFERQNTFRGYLIAWFAAITLLTLLVLTALLRVVLRPLSRLERQVRDVEAGHRQRLDGEFPAELTPLAGNLNALIDTERRRLVRYRNMLDDLAHSLKTPLAAMRSLVTELDGDAVGRGQAGALARELERMDQRVSYQLRRARASGATGLGVEPVAVAPVVDDLKQTLDKVYRSKGVVCTVAVAPSAVFHGDPGDLMELLGNLLDNAYKYCRSHVSVSVEMRPDRLVFVIADDGAGIGPDEAQRLQERGVRADESTPGQGIGLAVVRETVELYGGALEFGRSPLGGAEIRVTLGRAGYPL
jgi:two-component system, OmpR family, sensor histidine kinase PhoQ